MNYCKWCEKPIINKRITTKYCCSECRYADRNYKAMRQRKQTIEIIPKVRMSYSERIIKWNKKLKEVQCLKK